jgi:hypothetical protein
MTTTTTLATLSILSLAVAASNAQADDGQAPADATPLAAAVDSHFHADAEVDPTAYALNGYSLHVGIGVRHLRVDLGAYSMQLPKAMSGDDDLTVAFDGYGVKLQYFLFGEQKGGFIGVDAGLTRPTISKPDMQLAVRNTELGVGVNFGWRFTFGDKFYATPWLGIGYGINPHTVMLGESKYEGSHLTIFPAVHLGYRFR